MVGRKKTYIRFLLYFFLLVGAIFSGFPIIWMIFSSFKSNVDIFALPPIWVNEKSSIAAYVAIFSSPEKVRFFINSYLVSLVVVIFTLLIAIVAGYGFSRFDFPGKSTLNLMIISVQAIPPITMLIPYLSLIVRLGMHNTLWALILTYLVFTLPYAILIITGYFNTIPRDLDEAVLIDGGSKFRALWKILVPVSIPGLVSVGMYTFMMSWNEYLFALSLTKTNDVRTVPIGISLLMGQHAYEWNQMMAMSVLGSLPVLALFLFFQQYFIAGMTAGSVKS